MIGEYLRRRHRKERAATLRRQLAELGAPVSAYTDEAVFQYVDELRTRLRFTLASMGITAEAAELVLRPSRDAGSKSPENIVAIM